MVDTYAVLISGLSKATTFIGIKDYIDCAGIRAATTSKDFKNEECLALPIFINGLVNSSSPVFGFTVISYL